MSLENNLNEFLEKENDIKQDERFVIDSDKKADWALRKIAEAENEIEKIERFAEHQLRQIENWKVKQTEKHNNSIEHFQSLLAEFLQNKRKDDPEIKSVTLPSGNVGFRRNRDKWEYNNDLLLKSLEQAEMNELIRVKKEPNRSEIRKKLKVSGNKVVNPETGEVVEGIRIVEQGESLNVRLNK